MSMFEGSFMVYVGITVMAVLLFGTGITCVWLFRQTRLAQADIGALNAQLNMFTKASIEVARAVESLTLGSQEDRPQRLVSSRRWLIDEARTRLAAGDGLDEVSARLKLNDDEVDLLHRLCINQRVIAQR